MPVAFRSRRARTPLDCVIEQFWELRLLGADILADDVISPDGRCEFVVHLDDPPQRLLNGVQAFSGAAAFFGPLTHGLILRRQTAGCVRGVRFTQTGLWALSVRPGAWRDAGTTGGEALGDLGDGIEETARSAPSFDAFAAATENMVEHALPLRFTAPAPDLTLLLAKIERGALCCRKDIADFSGWTERHITRLVSLQTGHTPSELVRISRFQRARRLITESRLSLARIAALVGFADQSHMTKDVGRFASKSPKTLRRDSGLYADIYSAASN